MSKDGVPDAVMKEILRDSEDLEDEDEECSRSRSPSEPTGDDFTE